MHLELTANGFNRILPVKLERPVESVIKQAISGGSQRIGANCIMIPLDLKANQLAPSCNANIVKCHYTVDIKANVSTC